MSVPTPTELTAKKCKPCEGGVEALNKDLAEAHLRAVPEWQLSADAKMISRKWTLKNFLEAMRLLNLAADVAEEDQHHPDFHLTGYRHVRIDLTTHAIGGLSENDFIVAAKIDAAAEGMSS